MPDLHDELERLAARASAPPSTEELHVHRERRERRRARQALAAGLCVAILGTILAFSALRPGDPVPADTPSPTAPLVVWPSNEDHDAAQANADAWRLDPEKVIDRFARSVLGWGEPVIERTGPGSYLLGRGVEEEIGLHVAVAQPATTGEGGIWSIQSVAHPEMAISVGEDAAAFDIAIGDDRAAHVGVTVSNGCRDASEYEVGHDAGTFELPFPEPTADDPACPDLGIGYVFVYVMDDTTVPTGDPLLEAAAIEYPWLTVLPIELPMETSDVATTWTESLSVECAAGSTAIADDPLGVAARPSGVALFTYPSNQEVSLVFDGAAPRSFLTDYGPATVDLAPGPHTVACRYRIEGVNQTSEPVSFEVVDPNGYYVPVTDLTCPGPMVGTEEPYGGPKPVVDQGDLAFSSYEAVFPAADADVEMVLQGYPESPDRRIYAAVRPDGRTIARVLLAPIDEGWGVSASLVCD